MNLNNDLKSAIYLSLLCKKLTPNDTDSGWWANNLIGDEIGSFLYKTERDHNNNENIERKKNYTKEALSWLKEEPVIKKSHNNNLLSLRVEIKDIKIEL